MAPSLGAGQIETAAKYDTDTKEVFDIEMVDDDNANNFDREYIILPDGQEIEVVVGDDTKYYAII